LAKKEGKSEGWVCQRLRFGRFLNFLTTVSFSENTSFPKNLTEGRFREYWSKTEGGNERRRFIIMIARGRTWAIARTRMLGTSNLLRCLSARAGRKSSWQRNESRHNELRSHCDSGGF
jgi:hypothetical protein